MIGKPYALMFTLLLTASIPAMAQTITVGLSGDVASTEYSTKHDDNTSAVLHHMFESLVAYRDDMTIAPHLASEYSVSPDGKTYRFVLREGVTFHNGKPLTAAEVKWSWSRFLDPSRDWGTHCRELMDGGFEKYIRPAYVTEVRTPAPNIVEFELQSPNAMFLHHMANTSCIFGIAHPDSVDADGRWRTPIGTGPYKLEAHVPGQELRLVRHEGYRVRGEAKSGLAGKREALAERLTFKVIPDEMARADALASGRIDLMIHISDAAAERLKKARGISFDRHLTPAFFQLILQTRTDPLLRNPTIRRAIAHALDRRRIAEVAFGTGTPVNPSAVAIGMPGRTDVHDQTLPHDPAKARTLLANAGYSGEPLTIVASSAPYPAFARAAHEIAAQLRAVGLNITVEEVAWPTHDKRYADNEYQMTTMAFSPRTDPALMYSAIVGQKGDHSWYVWEDMDAERLVSASAVEADAATRTGRFEALHNKMIDWSPTIGIANYPRTDAYRTKLKGYSGWSMALPRLWGVTRPE